MATSSIDHSLTKGRSVHETGFASLCDQLCDRLRSTDRSTSITTFLRNFFFLIHCTKKPRNLSKKALGLLKHVLLEGPPGFIPLQCAAILQEYGPTPELIIDNFSPPVNPKNMASILSVSMCQGRDYGHLDKLTSQFVRWVSTMGFEYVIQTRALGALIIIASLHHDLLSGEQMYVISSQISDWLSEASIDQAPNPYTRRSRRPEQPLPVTEIDGAACQDFFTILSLGQYYSEDQLLNIWSFSSLKAWLIDTHLKLSSASSGQPQKVSQETRTFLSKAKLALIERACEYCLRVIDQSERTAIHSNWQSPNDQSGPLKVHDQELVEACLVEAISILDVVCKLDSSMIPKLFPALKRVYARISDDIGQPRVLCTIVQFYLNHCDAVVYDPQKAFDLFFGKSISMHYYDHAVAFDAIMLCRDNMKRLCHNTNILEKYFPNLLKILAWNPRTFLSEFFDLLPSFLSPTTALEVFHTLLDLPCLSAALEASHLAAKGASETVAEAGIRLACVDAFQNPDHRPWFNFILRHQSGQGDTINRLEYLHQMLEELKHHPRVNICSQGVPVLLNLYFETILEHGDYSLLCQLTPVILERAALLFNTPSYHKEVRIVLQDALLNLFRQSPSLVIDCEAELIEFVGNLRYISGKEDFFLHVVWSIGEYVSIGYDKRNTADIITKYYEALETLLYEVVMCFQSSNQEEQYSPRLVTVMMSAVTKLASRCQDLIPRVLLCLTKISQQPKIDVDNAENKTLISRANELINLLRLPNVASSILSPAPGIENGRWHSDGSVSIPILIKTIKEVVKV
ncbi:AP-5 complex subunit zeta-1-like isoform X2 [Anneissia japonica]|uniref:AP-5 complex subunit zeta-1-like isoform X2 n=1 Tax=Anneissia japonica TaxID=1529436 RepID=UPI001425AF7B|nr:AP-5 complex subunit zeta-1-like isoform X2 [Anneissia japonica]